MPSPYDLISRAKQQKKKEDGNKRADKWAALQVNTAQNLRPVAPPQEPAHQPSAANQPPTAHQPFQAYQPTTAQQPSAMPQPPGAQRPVHPTPNIDAIHKRHEQALKNANWQKVEKPTPKAEKKPDKAPEKAPDKAPDKEPEQRDNHPPSPNRPEGSAPYTPHPASTRSISATNENKPDKTPDKAPE